MIRKSYTVIESGRKAMAIETSFLGYVWSYQIKSNIQAALMMAVVYSTYKHWLCWE